MDVLTSERCWAVNWHNKASVIKLVYLYSNIKIMHGPIRIRILLFRELVSIGLGSFLLKCDIMQREWWVPTVRRNGDTYCSSCTVSYFRRKQFLNNHCENLRTFLISIYVCEIPCASVVFFFMYISKSITFFFLFLFLPQFFPFSFLSYFVLSSNLSFFHLFVCFVPFSSIVRFLSIWKFLYSYPSIFIF